MKIYFACSITGGRQFEAVYQAITRSLLEAGHEVPTAHLAETNVVSLEQIVNAREVYTRDVNWIQACDALIAEVSTPSHGVGYEVAYALGIGKPVLCCFQEGQKVSKMITGNPHERLQVSAYQDVNQAVISVHAFLDHLRLSL
jgi:nucleoside 2-deoxyribosyltransferase